MSNSSEIVKFVIIVLVIFIIGYFFVTFFMPRSGVKKYDGASLEQREENGNCEDDFFDTKSNVAFDLDNYEPKDELEAMLVDSMKEGRAMRAASRRLNRTLSMVSNDGRSFGRYLSKARFYYDKGEYKKAIRVIVSMLKKNPKSDVFKSRAYKLLADCYAELGIKKQYYKAMMRYYEVEMNMMSSEKAKKKFRVMKLKMEQKMRLAM